MKNKLTDAKTATRVDSKRIPGTIAAVIRNEKDDINQAINIFIV